MNRETKRLELAAEALDLLLESLERYERMPPKVRVGRASRERLNEALRLVGV